MCIASSRHMANLGRKPFLGTIYTHHHLNPPGCLGGVFPHRFVRGVKKKPWAAGTTGVRQLPEHFHWAAQEVHSLDKNAELPRLREHEHDGVSDDNGCAGSGCC